MASKGAESRDWEARKVAAAKGRGAGLPRLLVPSNGEHTSALKLPAPKDTSDGIPNSIFQTQLKKEEEEKEKRKKALFS